MKIEDSEPEDLQRKLNDLDERARAMNGTHEVPLNVLFNPDFMKQYTDFESMSAMFEAGGFTVKTTEDFRAIPDDQWDALVKSRTRFEDWKAMTAKATAEWASKQLGL